MKKIYLLLCICFVLSLLLSCNSKMQSVKGNEAVATQGAENGNISESSVENSGISGPLKIIHGRGRLSVSDDGYYQMYDNDDGSGNILYTDVATKQRIYLSSDLSSDHHSAADSSWIEDTLGGITLFAAGDYLFIHKNPYNENAGALYRADLNGENRKKFLDLQDYDIVIDAVIASDGGYLYWLLENKAEEVFIVKIDIENGTIEQLHKMPMETNFLLAVYDDCLIIETLNPPDLELYTDADDIYKNTKSIVYQYSLSTKQLSEVVQWNLGEITAGFDGNYIYMFDLLNDCLKSIDCRDNSEKILIDSLKDKGIAGDDIFIENVQDGHMIYSANGLSYSLDLSTLEITERKYLESNYKYPVIFGTFGDKYLVTAGELEIPFNSTDMEGNPMIATMYMSELALIDIQDYWDSNYNFEPIKNTFLEE